MTKLLKVNRDISINGVLYFAGDLVPADQVTQAMIESSAVGDQTGAELQLLIDTTEGSAVVEPVAEEPAAEPVAEAVVEAVVEEPAAEPVAEAVVEAVAEEPAAEQTTRKRPSRRK